MVVRKVSGHDFAPLLYRFSLIEEIAPAYKTRQFIARENHTVEQSLVKLRVYSPTDDAEESDLLAFLLETRAAAELTHENIVYAAKPEQLEGIHFAVSEHHEATSSLREVLNRRGWLEVEEAIGIARQIAQALQYAHGKEILHLQLQPDCIWVNDIEEVTVDRFGIPATPVRPWAYERRTSGCSLSYRSPEQLTGKQPDERSDLYALGVVLYEMLTDALPFNGATPEQLKSKISLQKMPPAHLIRPEIPETLSTMISRLLSEDPAHRFSNAGLLQAELAACLEKPLAAEILPDEIFLDELSVNESVEVAEIPGSTTVARNFVRVTEDEPLSAILKEFDEKDDSVDEPFKAPDTITQTTANERTSWVFDDDSKTNLPQPLGQLPAPFDLEQPEVPSTVFAGESARSKKPLSVVLLMVGIMLIITTSVLAYKRYVKAQVETIPQVQPVDLPTQPSLDDSASPVEHQSATPPDSSNSLNGNLPSPVTVPRAASPEVVRLHQQLRRTHQAKISRNKTYKNKPKAKPRKNASRWRFLKAFRR
ncbi:MAG: serine/threonine-protein kinase [Acidobacteriota bacterium]